MEDGENGKYVKKFNVSRKLTRNKEKTRMLLTLYDIVQVNVITLLANLSLETKNKVRIVRSGLYLELQTLDLDVLGIPGNIIKRSTTSVLKEKPSSDVKDAYFYLKSCGHVHPPRVLSSSLDIFRVYSGHSFSTQKLSDASLVSGDAYNK
ncbi:hypothetical protein Fmac_020972 [Flemingia macrophylla]|uniref:Uncharacterized protein n=1 Tax=Flemingia macrophylla TaxID=520843 RepID=A0ABD1LX93_9FABA